MATEKRLIDANAIKYTEYRGGGGRDYPENIVTEYEIDRMPTVSPDIKLLFCYIENRIPKAKFLIDGREVEITGYPVDFVEVVRCKDCVNGIYDEVDGIYKCVKSAECDPEYGDWIGFVSYHNADYYCADGERKYNGS